MLLLLLSMIKILSMMMMAWTVASALVD